jgi:hypothetical protein
MPSFFCAPTRPGTLQDRRCGSTAGRGFCDEGAGSRVRLGPAFNFVHFLQNNDQIGNRAVGDRLHTGINPDLNAASTEMLLLAPQVRQRKRPRTTVSPRFLRLTARSDNSSRPVASDAQSETAHSPASWNFKAIFLLSRRQFIPPNKEHDMPTKTLEDLFTDGIKDIYYAERKIVAGLKKMIRGAQSPDLKAAFEKHLQETEGQVERLVQVFELIGKPARGKTCPAIDGILEEGQEILEEFKGSDALDAGLRDRTIWHASLLGSPARKAGCGPTARTDPCRGDGDRRGFDPARGRQRQQEGQAEGSVSVLGRTGFSLSGSLHGVC